MFQNLEGEFENTHRIQSIFEIFYCEVRVPIVAKTIFSLFLSVEFLEFRALLTDYHFESKFIPSVFLKKLLLFSFIPNTKTPILFFPHQILEIKRYE